MPAPTDVFPVWPILTDNPPAPLYEVEWFSASTLTSILFMSFDCLTFILFASAITLLVNISVLKEPPADTCVVVSLVLVFVTPAPIATWMLSLFSSAKIFKRLSLSPVKVTSAPFIKAWVWLLFSIKLTAAPAPTVEAFATPPPIFNTFVSWFASTLRLFLTVIFALPTSALTLELFKWTLTEPAAAADILLDAFLVLSKLDFSLPKEPWYLTLLPLESFKTFPFPSWYWPFTSVTYSLPSTLIMGLPCWSNFWEVLDALSAFANISSAFVAELLVLSCQEFKRFVLSLADWVEAEELLPLSFLSFTPPANAPAKAKFNVWFKVSALTFKSLLRVISALSAIRALTSFWISETTTDAPIATPLELVCEGSLVVPFWFESAPVIVIFEIPSVISTGESTAIKPVFSSNSKNLLICGDDKSTSSVIIWSSSFSKGSVINWSKDLFAVEIEAFPAVTSKLLALIMVLLPIEDSVVPFNSWTTVLPEKASPCFVELPVIAVLIYDCWLAELTLTSPFESITTFSPICAFALLVT